MTPAQPPPGAAAFTQRHGRTERLVDPWGLVDKDDIWYLPAGAERGQRTFRVDRIIGAEPTDQPAERPDDFTLATAWQHVVGDVEQRRSRTWATVLVAGRFVPVLRTQFGRHCHTDGELDHGRARVCLAAPTPLDIAPAPCRLGRDDRGSRTAIRPGRAGADRRPACRPLCQRTLTVWRSPAGWSSGSRCPGSVLMTANTSGWSWPSPRAGIVAGIGDERSCARCRLHRDPGRVPQGQGVLRPSAEPMIRPIRLAVGGSIRSPRQWSRNCSRTRSARRCLQQTCSASQAVSLSASATVHSRSSRNFRIWARWYSYVRLLSRQRLAECADATGGHRQKSAHNHRRRHFGRPGHAPIPGGHARPCPASPGIFFSPSPVADRPIRRWLAITEAQR